MTIIDYRAVELSNEENKYYEELVKQFTTDKFDGKTYFKDLFITDNDGLITIIKPKNNIPWVIIHFVQQIQINQRLRFNDKVIDKLDKRIKYLEKRIDKIDTTEKK